ncbi:MAG: hypothetical protein AAF065_13305 [Verrucomicrobiota bacterium]
MEINPDLVNEQTQLLADRLSEHIEENPTFYRENPDLESEINSAAENIFYLASTTYALFEVLSEAKGMLIELSPSDLLENPDVIDWLDKTAQALSNITGEYKGVFEIHTPFISGDSENIWSEDGRPLTFPSEEAAQAAIDEYIQDRREAMKAGYLVHEVEDEELQIYNSLLGTYIN